MDDVHAVPDWCPSIDEALRDEPEFQRQDETRRTLAGEMGSKLGAVGDMRLLLLLFTNPTPLIAWVTSSDRRRYLLGFCLIADFAALFDRRWYIGPRSE